MRIGIDISQTTYQQTGVSTYLTQLVKHLVSIDLNNQYVLFFSSFRRVPPFEIQELVKTHKNVRLRIFKFPPTFLDTLWNKLHRVKIERFIGNIDMFITSDWTEPPVKHAKKATIIYDLIVYKFPEETDRSIVEVQKRKLRWVKKESDVIFTISESSKRDIVELLGIPEEKIRVLYPGI